MQARAEKAGVHRMGEVHRGKPKPLRPLKVVEKVVTDPSRDALLTEFGKTTLTDRYLLPGESYQDMFARVATAFAGSIASALSKYGIASRQLIPVRATRACIKRTATLPSSSPARTELCALST